MRGKNDDYSIIWSTLTSVFLAIFAIFETKAFMESRSQGKPLGTLSFWLRKVLGIHPRRSRRFVLVPLFAIVWGWFFPHIVFDKWNPPGTKREEKR